MNTTTPVLLLVLVYAAAVAAAGWLVLGPKRSTPLHERLRAHAAWAGTRIKSFANAPRMLLHSSFAAGAGLGTAVWRNRHKLALALALFAAPLGVLFTLGDPSRLQPYDDMAPSPDPVVAAVLDREKLVPPATLPPEIFTTREAGPDRTDLATASREWRMLDPDFRQRLLLVYRAMESHGYRMALLEGYRSPERQQMLAQLGPQVTNANAFQSYHQFGLAADSAFLREGRLVISEKDPWAMEGYRLYGSYAESFGLTWGGRWQLRDFGHVELRRRQAAR